MLVTMFNTYSGERIRFKMKLISFFLVSSFVHSEHVATPFLYGHLILLRKQQVCWKRVAGPASLEGPRAAENQSEDVYGSDPLVLYINSVDMGCAACKHCWCHLWISWQTWWSFDIFPAAAATPLGRHLFYAGFVIQDSNESRWSHCHAFWWFCQHLFCVT